MGKSVNPAIKAEALRMLEQGIHQNEVARSLNLTVRTIQKWKSETKAQLPQEAQALSPLPKSGIDWLEGIEISLNSHAECHYKVWKKIEERLLEELENPEASTKNINTLSLALDRHLQGELRSRAQGKSDVLTYIQAFKLLESYGYAIIPKSQMNELGNGEKTDA